MAKRLMSCYDLEVAAEDGLVGRRYQSSYSAHAAVETQDSPEQVREHRWFRMAAIEYLATG